MKRLAAILSVSATLSAIALVAIAGFRTAMAPSRQIEAPQALLPRVNTDNAVAALQAAIRLPTISYDDRSMLDVESFMALHKLLQERFPLSHERLLRETVGDYSLLFTWQGTDPEIPGVLLLAHQDVVTAGEESDWTHPPFSGILESGFIWGRGALDDKGSLIAILAAVEQLLQQGFTPHRNVYLCFGHDEEVGGWEGAASIAKLLASRGKKAAFSLDEGMSVVDGEILGIAGQIAFVSLTEKGYLSLKLTVHGTAGHASTPPRETTLGILSCAVARLEACPMPARMPEPLRNMFAYLGPEMHFPMNAVFANLWLTKPLVMRQLASSPITDAAIRTTTAVTIMEGGSKDNVLPATGHAVVNFRLLPGDTIEQVQRRVRQIIADQRIEVSIYGKPNESPAPACIDMPDFDVLHRTVRHVFPQALFAPSMMLASSDSHHYKTVTDNLYGFSPMYLTKADMESIHGPNERIGVQDFERMIQFYMLFLQHTAGVL